MKGDAKVIDYLNKGLRSELTASASTGCITAARQLGLQGPRKKWRKDRSRRWSNADKFVERIIFLDGFPTCRCSIR